MAAGDVTPVWSTAVALTVTNLQALASDTSHLGCWESASIDFSGALYGRFTADIQVESSGLAAGEIKMYLVGQQHDISGGKWPDVFDGTESTETITDVEIRNAICREIARTDTDTTASRTYPLDSGVVYGLPKTGVVVITQSTGAALESTGSPNKVWVWLAKENVATS